jgi:hypothetical protein
MRVIKSRLGKEYRSVLSVDGKAGLVVDINSKAVVFECVATSAHKTKIKLKKALEELGVKFGKETRTDKDSV